MPRKKKKINIKMLNRALFALIVVIGLYYIAGINDLTVKGFELQRLKAKTIELKNDNNALETKIMALSSYNNLSERIASLDMVRAEKVEYVSGAGAFVAKK